MLNLPTNHKQCRVEILVQGTVQGVGFRPFIYNLATRLCITGSVINTGAGVRIHAQAEDSKISAFTHAIRAEAPPLAVVDSVTSEVTEEMFDTSQFSILTSNNENIANTAIPPDINLCSDCLTELLDPENRRFCYPFINCTNCGPRYTIIESIPYDRKETSMKVFPMCEECNTEYNDPTNRRFHAQPNACPACGPKVTFHDGNGNTIASPEPIAAAVARLAAGDILAIRGLGGFHLSVNACSTEAVARLRHKKNRPNKPLAIMVPNLEAACKICYVRKDDATLLQSFEHPIVLLRRKQDGPLAANIAPDIEELGVMLPYTPLHHLLFREVNCPKALVMTSGNMSGTPICIGNEEATDRLSHCADYFLLHNREILTRVDDSVVKNIDGVQLILRRARGYAPAKIRVAEVLPQILGCGAGLKNTFSLAKDNNIFPSQYIGDLDNLETTEFYQESIGHLQRLYQIEPEAVACDLHPDYPSSHYAKSLNLPIYPVQHHHAHAVAVMAEHGLTEPVLAVVLDGVGLGTDGTLWGGEILLTSLIDFERLAHLGHLPMVGGDAAAKEPWRMAISALYTAFGKSALSQDLLPATLMHLDSSKIDALRSMLENGFNCPQTSSCGRLFDSVASLLGVCHSMSYEGQAAMELEALAKTVKPGDWPQRAADNDHTEKDNFLHKTNEIWQINTVEFVQRIMSWMQQAVAPATIALDFHRMILTSVTQLVEHLAAERGIEQVVLCGGCMQNSLLMEGFIYLLKQQDLEVYTGNALPINDGAISIGQTIIGGLRHVSCNSDESNRRSG